MALMRFYWVIEDQLAGCSLPGRSGPVQGLAIAAALNADLAELRERGIGALLTLTETPLPEDALLRYDLEWLHLPVPDMAAPTPQDFDLALSFLDQQRFAGRAVAVHCLMGQGRTGAILAAYLIRAGAAPDAAMAQVRDVCPGAICAEEQERALHAFARRRDWIL